MSDEGSSINTNFNSKGILDKAPTGFYNLIMSVLTAILLQSMKSILANCIKPEAQSLLLR